MRCLIVEDDPELAQLWRIEAEDHGVEADVVESESDAFEAMLRRPYGVVVTDLHLPDGSGISVAQTAAFRSPDAKVIVITGTSDFPYGELFQTSSNICSVMRKSEGLETVFHYIAHLERRRPEALAAARV